MRPKVLMTAAVAAAIVTTLAACSSSKKATSTGPKASSSSSASSAPLKFGVLTDLTGASASGFSSTEKGVKAYVDGVNRAGGINGQKLEYVVADTTSTPAGALTAAQKLVQTDKVFAIVEVSALYYGAHNYLLKQGVPVIGGGFDSPIWTDPKNINLFDVAGIVDYTKVRLADGQFFKAQGVTKCAAIGYSDSPSSSASIKGFDKSCQIAGMQSVFTQNVPFGSTDMGAIAIKIKQSGADGLYYSTVPNTAFALNAALRQLGVTMKLITLPTGYGGDLLQSAAAVTAAQGDFFSTVGLPAEANTPATQKRAADLAAVGVTGPPTFAQQEAYLAMAGLARGLKDAGTNPTRDKFISVMSGIKDFDGDGLLAPQKIDFRNYSPSQYCTYYVKLQGKTFQNVQGSPYCAATVPLNG